MKKILLFFILTLITTNLFSQVKFYDGDLKESISKAKAENKQVMIFASASW